MRSPVALYSPARPGDDHLKRRAVLSADPIRAFKTPSVAACEASQASHRPS
jgi:hypothetical protein